MASFPNMIFALVKTDAIVANCASLLWQFPSWETDKTYGCNVNHNFQNRFIRWQVRTLCDFGGIMGKLLLRN